MAGGEGGGGEDDAGTGFEKLLGQDGTDSQWDGVDGREAVLAGRDPLDGLGVVFGHELLHRAAVFVDCVRGGS